MQIGIIGLGRMGMNMARRLMSGGHEVVAYNRSPEKVDQIRKEGAIGAESLEDLVSKLTAPRIVWMMLPIGGAIDDNIAALKKLLSKGDILVEGGNSHYKDDVRRAKDLEEHGIHYVDAGVSGGIWGLKNGYSTMIGGEENIFRHIEPVVKTLAPEGGYMYCGPYGAGHFVKMIHNGIEYALMEGYGEGFEILKAGPYGENLDLKKVAAVWNRGSVIRSWLLELLEDAFKDDPALEKIQGYVEDSGEGRWTVTEAVESGVDAGGIAHALFRRFGSRQQDAFSNKVLAALRNQFGGHSLAHSGESITKKNAGAGHVNAAHADKNRAG